MQSLLAFEIAQAQFGDIEVREVKLAQQYDDEFLPIIQKYKTAGSICGYYATGLCPFFGKNVKRNITYQEINGYIYQFQDPQKLIPLLVPPMQYINESRIAYSSKHPILSKDKKKTDGYIRDWVANYEISDYFQSLKDLDSHVYFLRQVA